MKNKKQYISPKVTAVKLDPQQAILQVCKAFNAAGGAWMTAAVCIYGRGTGGGFKIMQKPVGCVTGLKVGAGTATGDIQTSDYQTAGS
jgi:hypothetical protein